jgi:hypothetical protein
MSDDQIVAFIRDEFNRLHARLDEHFEADHQQDVLCTQHHTEWRLFKWAGGFGVAGLMTWLGWK